MTMSRKLMGKVLETNQERSIWGTRRYSWIMAHVTLSAGNAWNPELVACGVVTHASGCPRRGQYSRNGESIQSPPPRHAGRHHWATPARRAERTSPARARA